MKGASFEGLGGIKMRVLGFKLQDVKNHLGLRGIDNSGRGWLRHKTSAFPVNLW